MKDHVKVFLFTLIVVPIVGIGAWLLLDTVILGNEFSDIRWASLILQQVALAFSVGIVLAYTIKKKNEK